MKKDELDPELTVLVDKIARARGFGFASYKVNCLRRRIAVRMRACGVHTYEQYGEVLDSGSDEYDRLLDTLTINVTKFYRNRETWDAFNKQVLPALWEKPIGMIRCWSAGCSSGEEPYTLAILLLEYAPKANRTEQLHLRVDATDFDRASLERARAGVYEQNAFREMPRTLLRRYFTHDERPSVNPAVRNIVHFRRHDITRERPPVQTYDLIVCRNVLIYFDRKTQERLFLQFVDALQPGGFLVLGKAETLSGDARSRLTLENPRERIYRRP